MQGAPAAHEDDVFSKALEPLRQYALLHLTAASLAHMRGVSTSAQLLVDEHTGSIWKAAATRLLDPACLHDSHHASEVQCTLREQGALLENFRADNCTKHHTCVLNPTGGVYRGKGEAAAYEGKMSAEITKPCPDSPMMLWQPPSTVSGAADGPWLIIGQQALNTRTLAATTLAPDDWTLEWIRWCSDGLHAVMLLSDYHPSTPAKHQIRVSHVASGTVTASLECADEPTVYNMVCSAEGHCMEMHMPCKAQAVLVPEALHVVSLRRLPSFDSMARIAAPEFGGQPASLLCMGLADHGGLIVVVWEAADAEVVVTVHSALSGASLQHMLHLTPHDPHDPIFKNDGVVKAFAASPNDPIAAIAWQSGGSNIHVALLDLTCGTQTNVQRPSSHHTRGTCYSQTHEEEMEFAWSPGGRYLMVFEDANTDGKGKEWAIFTSQAGVFIGPESGVHHYIVPPMWSSDLLHPFCLIGDGLGVAINAMDLSIVPPRQLSYLNLNSSRSGAYADFSFDPAFTFVPGTRDLVVFPYDYQHCPIQHWTFDSSKGSSVCHDVLGFNKDLAGAFAVENMAWQPTIKSAPIYALAEKRQNGALHLIDAQTHRPLITWTSEQMTNMLQGPMSINGASLAWSHDGKELAVVTSTGTAILSFPS